MGKPTENLAGRILQNASEQGWGAKTALREGDRRVSYEELGLQVSQLAAGLRKAGIGPGDRVGIFMPDSIECALSLLAIVYAGAVAVPISELVSVNELRDVLNSAAARAVVVDQGLREPLSDVKAEIPALDLTIVVGESARTELCFEELLQSAPLGAPHGVAEGDTALLLFSAGARATNEELVKRRGVPHSHVTPLRAYETFARGFLQLSHEDRVFSTVRMSTAYGLGAGVLFPLLAGAEAIRVPQQAHSSVVFDTIEKQSPTIFFATPSVYGQLARDVAQGFAGSQWALAGLRWCVSGAEDMPPKVVAMARAVLGASVTVGYGLTEAFQFVIAGRAAAERPGSCGLPVEGFELRIVNDNGAEVGSDEIGTLHIKGSTIASRYWPEQESTTQDDGWFITRDRFMRDASGVYYHCGRVDQQFKVGGKWVAPAEVEQALLENEAVWECAVVGADDEDGLIKPLAFVVPNIGHEPGDALEAELREYVKKVLAPYKYPRWIEFVEELPKGPSGVTLRYKLRDRLRSSRGRRRAETRS
jgi:benzoate-CoA ligase